MRSITLKVFLIVFLGSISFFGHAQADTLKVMSFNILHGATTKNDFNLDTIAGVINYYQPDLVALQEVDFRTNRAKNYDLPTELGIRTKMASLFARAMYYDGGEYGEAVLSKFTFIGSENVALPHLPDSEPRAALVTRIKTKNGNTIQFVGTHLDHLKDETDRVMQAKSIVAHLGDTEYPTLLVGDLNSVPTSTPIHIISEKFSKPEHPNAWNGTYPATGPTKCIDHIMYNMPKKWQLLDYEVLCENYASDHCIVIATLLFTP
jgi:endonuclease/exonuclease/phosphatase family metal-dependent hydrolase